MRLFQVAVVVGAVVGLFVASPAVQAQAKKKRVSQNVIVRDETAVADAKIDLDKAKSDYTKAMTQKRQDFEHSDDLKNAQKKVTDCTKAVNDARAAALGKLDADPAYQELKKAEEAAQKKVDALKKSGAPADQVSLASQDVLKVGGQISALERKATASDDTLTAASKQLVDANGALTKMNNDFAASLKTDKDLLDLKKKQDDATTKLAKAKAKLDTDNKEE